MALNRIRVLIPFLFLLLSPSHVHADPSLPATLPRITLEAKPPSSVALPTSTAGDLPQTEVIPAKEYVEFSELDPLPENAIKWSINSGKYLYVSQTELPYIYLSGSLVENAELQFNHRWIPTDGKAFEIKVPLKLEPTIYTLRIFRKNRQFQSYRLVNYWLKLPAGLRLKVQEDDRVVEQGATFSEKYNRSAFVQLYSGDHPTAKVDLDAQKHAELTFRVYPPPEPEATYDGWNFVVRNEKKQIVGETSRYGMPPAFIDWRDVCGKVFDRGEYTYQLNLTREDSVYEGPPQKFETTEGLGQLSHSYLPNFSLEPRQELGFFNFSNSSGLTYANLYVGADVALVFWNRFIARGLGAVSLHSLDPNQSFGYTRFGGGVRFFGNGENNVLGRPYIYQLDVLINHTAFTISPQASVRRYTGVSLLIEPKLVLWGYHHVIPWVEYSARAQLDFQRISLGLSYQFYVRPWSASLGLGAAYDHLFQYTADPTLRFQIFRTLLTIAFFL